MVLNRLLLATGKRDSPPGGAGPYAIPDRADTKMAIG